MVFIYKYDQDIIPRVWESFFRYHQFHIILLYNVMPMSDTLQFLYILKLRKDLHEEANWTKTDNKIVEQHFLRLQADTLEGKVILAGRTLNEDPSSFGIVIFEADSEIAAREYMDTDPAVLEGVMNATLFPYSVALMKKNP